MSGHTGDAELLARIDDLELRVARLEQPPSTWVRCDQCQARCCTTAFLRLHKLRRCPGPIDGPIRVAA